MRHGLGKILKHSFTDELEALKKEIAAYPREADLWLVSGEINNSAGNLALHQIGSLKYMVGTALGGTGYIRDRPGEFSRSGVPRSALLAEIDETIDVVRTTLDALSDDALEHEFPVAGVAPVSVSTRTFLVRLVMHTSYHNGQINYHRRLVAATEAAARSAE